MTFSPRQGRRTTIVASLGVARARWRSREAALVLHGELAHWEGKVYFWRWTLSEYDAMAIHWNGTRRRRLGSEHDLQACESVKIPDTRNVQGLKVEYLLTKIQGGAS